MFTMNEAQIKRRMSFRLMKNKLGKLLFTMAMAFVLFILAVLLYQVVKDGIAYLNIDFLFGKTSTDPAKAGIFGAVLGTMWLMLVVIPTTMFIGAASAIYLELYMKKSWFRSFIQTNIANLAGVPSIVYGILGMTVFVRLFGLGNIVLSGGLTIVLLILPIAIVASQEAIRAVPPYQSEASYGMGATKWQTIRRIVLPAALPSILTGNILALSRAIGETAPLIVIGIPALIIPFPNGLFDTFTVLPVQVYYWTLDSTLTHEYAGLAAATIIVLLACMLTLNLTAIFIRHKFQKVNEEGEN